jgi:hypothetical protein
MAQMRIWIRIAEIRNSSLKSLAFADFADANSDSHFDPTFGRRARLQGAIALFSGASCMRCHHRAAVLPGVPRVLRARCAMTMLIDATAPNGIQRQEPRGADG